MFKVLCIVYQLICYTLAKHMTFYLTVLCQKARLVYYTIFLIYIRSVQKLLKY